MKIKSYLTGLFCFFLFFISVSAQEKISAKPQTLTTERSKIIGKIERKEIAVEGQANFKLTACNSDGSLVGILTFEPTEKSRRKIGDITTQAPEKFPTRIIQKDVIAELANDTECPVLKLELEKVKLKIFDEEIAFAKFSLNLKETKQELSLVICALARGLNHGRGIRGLPRRCNEFINGLETP